LLSIQYLWAELTRRKGRTLLTAIGLGVGIGLVVAVSALTGGLEAAQGKVLEPLTGVGTDMTATRPIDADGDNQVSDSERSRLRDEAGPRRVGLGDLGDPGEKFTRTEYVPGGQLTFDQSDVAKVASIDSVADASPSLTLNEMTVSGTVPEDAGQPSGGGPQGRVGVVGGPESIDFESRSVTGIELDSADLGPVTLERLADGRFPISGKREALLASSYAKEEDLAIGDSTEIDGKKFEVVGTVATPLGGNSSDVYVELSQLQKLTDNEDRVNALHVRADGNDAVSSVAAAIPQQIDGAEVTTAQALAARVGGSVVDARKLADKLGFALQVVALLAAVLLAGLLTLNAIAKRTRELGTLKAIGWKRRRVVRQVLGETFAISMLGAAVGIFIGVGGAAIFSALDVQMTASVADTAVQIAGPGPAGPGPGGPFGAARSAVQTGSQAIDVDAVISGGLVALAVALALLAGLLTGAAGGLRAARLQPAAALRRLE
jgi:ABC-type antimicrobial peptide transport system permease subunit